jgi:hypothetical protein
MESIVSVVVVTDSIVSVHRNYEKRKRQRTGGKRSPTIPDSMTLISRRAGLLVGYKADNRLSVGFCERVIYLFKVCARVNFFTAAGYSVLMRADFPCALSCTTAAFTASAKTLFVLEIYSLIMRFSIFYAVLPACFW